MKKRTTLLLWGITALLAILWLIAWLTIPAIYPVARTAGAKVNSRAALRSISDTSSWRAWWPQKMVSKDSGYQSGGLHFSSPAIFYNAVHLTTEGNGFTTSSSLLIIPASLDSVILSWTDTVRAGWSVWSRWRAGRAAASRGEAAGRILSALKAYLNDPVNVYGFRIYNEMSKDSTLISTTFVSPDSPGTALIYAKLDELKYYIARRKASVVNFPMMHIDGKPGNYSTMLAYPVNRSLPDSANFRFKRFFPWKMVTAEVHGGETNVRNGYRQFYQYVQDFSISVMANGFAFLVTDRRQEPDSSKWITRISAPVP